MNHYTFWIVKTKVENENKQQAKLGNQKPQKPKLFLPYKLTYSTPPFANMKNKSEELFGRGKVELDGDSAGRGTD
ncbi:hFGF2-GFP fusion protein [Sesbania bispinosa]|nr:hFGF2-GFP fusion protein [Sesbania bispinosa]